MFIVFSGNMTYRFSECSRQQNSFSIAFFSVSDRGDSQEHVNKCDDSLTTAEVT